MTSRDVIVTSFFDDKMWNFILHLCAKFDGKRLSRSKDINKKGRFSVSDLLIFLHHFGMKCSYL